MHMGFDGIDLNMASAASGVLQRGACSGLINNRPLAKEIIDATKEGAGGLIPVSVKTRLGFRTIDFDWINFIQSKSIVRDRKSTRLNSSHLVISYAVFCLKKKKK